VVAEYLHRASTGEPRRPLPVRETRRSTPMIQQMKFVRNRYTGSFDPGNRRRDAPGSQIAWDRYRGGAGGFRDGRLPTLERGREVR